MDEHAHEVSSVAYLKAIMAPQSLRRSPPRELPNFSVSEGLVSHPPRDRQRDPSSSAACDLLVRAPSATLSLSAVRCDTVVPFATAASAATSVVAAASGQRAPPSARGRASSAARDLLVSAVCRESAVRDSCLSRNERRRDSVGAGNSVRARTSLERRPRPPREPCPRAPSSSCRPHDPHRRAPSAARAPSARRRPREPRPRALSATAVISAERCPRAVRDSCRPRDPRPRVPSAATPSRRPRQLPRPQRAPSRQLWDRGYLRPREEWPGAPHVSSELKCAWSAARRAKEATPTNGAPPLPDRLLPRLPRCSTLPSTLRYRQCLLPKLQCKNLSSLQGPLNVTSTCASFAEKRPVLVHATAEGSEAGAEQPEEPKPVTKIEDMPLELKQKMIMEQRARMKLAKKLRQRRKRLLRKRKLRKKGRWPQSKMKKLKNV